MTTRLTFTLDTVHQLAEHAATGTDRDDTTHQRPALLLCSGTNGIWLTSNAPHPQPAPANQPGTLDRLVAFAHQCPPGTPERDQAHQLDDDGTPLPHALPLDEPTHQPLLQQLRAAHLAGATTVIVLLATTGPSIAVGRRRERSTARHPQPADRAVNGG